jgi:tRNA-dihydrouridine synthase C
MKEAVHIPVAANGDIFTVEDYQRCIEITGCEHVALGRGAFADPFLALKIKSFQTQQPSEFFMSSETKIKILKKFIQKAQELQKSESFTVQRIKQWSKYLDAKSHNCLFEKIKKTTTLSEIDTCFEAHSSGAK